MVCRPRPSLRLISPVARASWGKMALRRLDLPAPELPQKAVMPWERYWRRGSTPLPERLSTW